jgi:hypothetical protein
MFENHPLLILGLRKLQPLQDDRIYWLGTRALGTMIVTPAQRSCLLLILHSTIVLILGLSVGYDLLEETLHAASYIKQMSPKLVRWSIGTHISPSWATHKDFAAASSFT